MKFTLFEQLESRQLMSATPVFNPTLLADRLEVKADLLAFRSDAIGGEATLLADFTALKGDGLKSDSALLPLVQKFHADVVSMHKTLLGDRLNESAAALADESVIVKGERQALLDRGNPTAEAADHTALLSDRIKLQADLLTGLNNRIATRQAATTTLFNDATAISTALTTDTTASAKLVADVTKLVNDRTTLVTKLTSDLTTIVAAREQLSADLTASLS